MGTATQVCSKCGIEKPATPEYFYLMGRKKYGDALRPDCKDCKKAQDNQRYHRQQQEINTQDGNKTCSRCGQTFPATKEYFFTIRGNVLRADCKTCYGKRRKQLRNKDVVLQDETPTQKVAEGFKEPAVNAPVQLEDKSWRNQIRRKIKPAKTPRGRIIAPRNDNEDAEAVRQVLDVFGIGDVDAPLVDRVRIAIEERDDAKRTSLRLIAENAALRD